MQISGTFGGERQGEDFCFVCGLGSVFWLLFHFAAGSGVWTVELVGLGFRGVE